MSLTARFRPDPAAVAEVTALLDDGLTSSQPLTGYAWPAGLTEGRNGEITAWLCLGTAGDAAVYYRATETKALTRLIQAAWDLRRQMFLARLKGRHAMWGAKP